MTVAEMLVEARSIFNQTDASNSAITDTQLIEWANQYYRRIQYKLGTVPLKERDYTQAETVTLNSRTLFINHVRILEASTSEYKTLEMWDLSRLIENFPDFENDDADIPRYAVRTGTFEIRLYPAPNAANAAASNNLRTHGQEFPSDLTSSDTPDLPLHTHDIFPHWLAYRSFRQLGQRESSLEELNLARERFRELKSSADNLQREKRWEFQ